MRITGPSHQHLADQAAQFEELVMAGVRQALNVAAKDIRLTSTGDDMAVIKRVFTDYTAETLMPWLQNSYQAAVTAQRNRIMDAVIAAGFTIPAPATTLAEQYLATASNRLTGISDAVWNHTRSELLAGMQAGESIPQLRKRVQNVAGVSKPRATMIARTEVIGAQNRGSLDSTVAAGMPGTKNWLATRDAKTRPSHAAANGQTRSLLGPDNEFSVGGSSMDGPHDPSAPPGETINCRCTLTYELDDEAVQEASDGVMWDQLSPEDAFDRSLNDELRQLIDSRPGARELLMEAYSGSTTYARGDALINVRDVTMLDQKKLRELMATTDQLIRDAPPVNGNVRIQVGKIDDPSGTVMGYTTLGTHSIVVGENVLRKGLPDYFDSAAGSTGHFMPAGESHSRVSYVLAHEWGHALEPPDAQELGAHGWQLINVRNAYKSDLSGYGKTSVHEAYAEAFAEWWLTRGLTQNPAAQAYAREFGWRLP